MTAREARLTLGLGPFGPFTDAELKAAHRASALRYHPDRGGDSEAFRQVQAAYELLRDGGHASGNGCGPGPEVDGRPAGEFGHGDPHLPKCGECAGRGYREIFQDTGREPCGRCRGLGFVVALRCKFCRGSGCRRCGGTGRYHLRRPGRCFACDGVGWKRAQGRAERRACPGCRGSGRVAAFNPVIPPGAILR